MAEPDDDPRVAFITYDGLLEPLGQSQVLPYVRALAKRGVSMGVVSFEKPHDLADTARVVAMERDLRNAGIAWTRLRYHKRPAALATAYDIVRGAVAVAAVIRRGGARLLHCRSYVPAVMAWLATRLGRVPFLFDMRGFWVDERVEGGLWARGGALYRAGKWWERRLLRCADGIVVLASAAIPHLDSLAGRALAVPTAVIPTCVDLQAFHPDDQAAVRGELGLPANAFVLIYAGSLGTWYLGPETFAFAAAVASQVESFAMVVLSRETDVVGRLLPESLAERTTVKSVAHGEVARWMSAADAGIALIRPTFSKTASCPTKLGEYLACGIPVVATRGVGDVERLLTDDVGVLLDDCGADSLQGTAARLIRLAGRPETGARCRARAVDQFSLEDGAERFQGMYVRCIGKA